MLSSSHFYVRTVLDGDWEDGLPWLLLAAREVVQESTGFSSNDLLFGHTVQGPLCLRIDGRGQIHPVCQWV